MNKEVSLKRKREEKTLALAFKICLCLSAVEGELLVLDEQISGIQLTSTSLGILTGARRGGGVYSDRISQYNVPRLARGGIHLLYDESVLRQASHIQRFSMNENFLVYSQDSETSTLRFSDQQLLRYPSDAQYGLVLHHNRMYIVSDVAPLTICYYDLEPTALKTTASIKREMKYPDVTADQKCHLATTSDSLFVGWNTTMHQFDRFTLKHVKTLTLASALWSMASRGEILFLALEKNCVCWKPRTGQTDVLEKLPPTRLIAVCDDWLAVVPRDRSVVKLFRFL